MLLAEKKVGHPLLDLTRKTAVVIGGTSGIGLTLARGLATAGANVIPTGRRSELVRAASQEIVALGRKSLPITCDVTSKENLKALLDAVCRTFGSVQILVNCGLAKRSGLPLWTYARQNGARILETKTSPARCAPCRSSGRQHDCRAKRTVALST